MDITFQLNTQRAYISEHSVDTPSFLNDFLFYFTISFPCNFCDIIYTSSTNGCNGGVIGYYVIAALRL